MDELSDPALLWLALQNLPGVGGVQAGRLLDRAGSIAGLLEAPDVLLSSVMKPPSLHLWKQLQHARSQSQLAQKALRDRDYLAETGAWLLTRDSPDYPPLLREIAAAPPVLVGRGCIQALVSPQLAIVGSRKASPGGRALAHRLAGGLARAGLCVTSGMALGIDAEAHRGALAADGLTLAVQATGIDRIYPASHRKLAEAIQEKGAVLTEFPVGAAPKKDHFPRRNRLISGLGLGIVVVEASIKSGTMITARYALEQNREVFAVPATPGTPGAEGPNVLLKQGAALVEHVGDILDVLPIGTINPGLYREEDECPVVAQKSQENFTPVEEKLLCEMDKHPRPVDELVRQSGMDAAKVMATLLGLELKNAVLLVAGGYIRC